MQTTTCEAHVLMNQRQPTGLDCIPQFLYQTSQMPWHW